jgi:hypothetical protein
MKIQNKHFILITLALLSSISLSKIIAMDVEDLASYLQNPKRIHKTEVKDEKKSEKNEDPFADDETLGLDMLFGSEEKSEEVDPFANDETLGLDMLFEGNRRAEETGDEHDPYNLSPLFRNRRAEETGDEHDPYNLSPLFRNRRLEDTGTEAVIDPLEENNEEVEPPVEEANTETTENTVTVEPLEQTNTEQPVESIGFQKRPNSGEQIALWSALCETKYHGTHWGKSDDENSYFTLGSKSYLCPEYSKRDDLKRIDFNSEENVSPCPQLLAEDSRGLKWAPVIVETTYGEIPGKVRYFEDSQKTRTTGVFSYMGRSYRGPIKAWLC